MGFFYVLVSTVMFATNVIWGKMPYDAGISMWQILTLESLVAIFFGAGVLAAILVFAYFLLTEQILGCK